MSSEPGYNHGAAVLCTSPPQRRMHLLGRHGRVLTDVLATVEQIGTDSDCTRAPREFPEGRTTTRGGRCIPQLSVPCVTVVALPGFTGRQHDGGGISEPDPRSLSRSRDNTASWTFSTVQSSAASAPAARRVDHRRPAQSPGPARPGEARRFRCRDRVQRRSANGSAISNGKGTPVQIKHDQGTKRRRPMTTALSSFVVTWRHHVGRP